MQDEIEEDDSVFLEFDNVYLIVSKLLSSALGSVTNIENAEEEIGFNNAVFFYDESLRFKDHFIFYLNTYELEYEIPYGKLEDFILQSFEIYTGLVLEKLAKDGILNVGVDECGNIIYWNPKKRKS
jgi:hypothetical protein